MINKYSRAKYINKRPMTKNLYKSFNCKNKPLITNKDLYKTGMMDPSILFRPDMEFPNIIKDSRNNNLRTSYQPNKSNYRTVTSPDNNDMMFSTFCNYRNLG